MRVALYIISLKFHFGITTHYDTLVQSYTHDLTFSVAYRFKNNLTVSNLVGVPQGY